jgi:1,4-dihydroxy-2-naphthoate octaprenyltransferase
VSKVSNLRKLGAVARVATEQAKRSRMVRATTSAVATTARAFGRVLHQLWLEVTGLIFLIMALSFGAASVKEYGKYHAGQAGLGRVAVAICFTVTFAWFGVSSFWRVRRKGRSSVR